jgi:hypothetical protein
LEIDREIRSRGKACGDCLMLVVGNRKYDIDSFPYFIMLVDATRLPIGNDTLLQPGFVDPHRH